MILKKLEISGFKSFDKKLILDFNRSITGIVGPNGSGKSNILEAFRFVLGEQSLKTMRGRKGEDLIFNGGNFGSRKNLAYIKIFFDNKKNVFDMEYPEITIERRVHRDGANEYLINSAIVRLKDIIELLTKANITPRGNQIISQGQADWVLNTNPVNRKEIIEDGLGLKIFQYRRKEAERKLERTKNQIKEIEMIRKEMLPHLKFLKRQAEKIKKSRELREELKLAYENYIPIENIYLSTTEKEIKTALEDSIEKLKGIDDKLKGKEIKTEKNDYSEEIEKMKAEVIRLNGMKSRQLLLLGRLEGKREIAKEVKGVSMEDFEKAEREVIEIIEEGKDEQNVSILQGLLQKIRLVFQNLHIQKVEFEDERKYEEAKKDLEEMKVKEEELSKKINEAEKRQKKESEETYEQEKEVLLLRNKKTELEGIKIRSEERLNTLLVEKRSFEDEMNEGRVLIGKIIDNFIEKKGEIIDRETQEKKRRDIERLKIKLEELGTTNEDGNEIENQHRDLVSRDENLENEINDLHQAMNSIEEMIQMLTKDIDKKFKNGIVEINKHFNSYFKTLFGTGSAKISSTKLAKRKKVIYDEKGEEIEIEGEEEQEGIDINISLPHKKIKSLDALSGGERALVSIALLFSISQVSPPPFLILDETDAALDEANSKRYGDIIEQLSKESQLILITHNRETMGRANVLYGVTMSKEGASKVLSVKLSEAVNVAK